MRVTIACPAALIPDARHLAMVLGYGPADADTYTTADWRDGEGNLYACASAVVGPGFVGAATTPLTRPAWDMEPYRINMAGARRAQAVVALLAPDEAGVMPDLTPTPERITAVPGDDALGLLAAMGLRRKETGEDV